MHRIWYIILVVLALVILSCQKVNNKSVPSDIEKNKSQPAVNVRYNGEKIGCAEHWDEFYCGPKDLADGNNTTIVKDSNNTPVILNKGK